MPTKFVKRQVAEGVLYSDIVFIDNTDSPYTVLAATETVHVDTSTAVVTVNLPAVSSSNTGRRITIRDKGNAAATNNITISPDGSDTINGASSLVISTNREAVTLESDGTSEWGLMTTNLSSAGSGGLDDMTHASSASLTGTEYTKSVTVTNGNTEPAAATISYSGSQSAEIKAYDAADFSGGDTEGVAGKTPITIFCAAGSSGTKDIRVGRASGSSVAITDADVVLTQSSGNQTTVGITASALSFTNFEDIAAFYSADLSYSFKSSNSWDDDISGTVNRDTVVGTITRGSTSQSGAQGQADITNGSNHFRHAGLTSVLNSLSADRLWCVVFKLPSFAQQGGYRCMVQGGAYNDTNGFGNIVCLTNGTSGQPFQWWPKSISTNAVSLAGATSSEDISPDNLTAASDVCVLFIHYDYSAAEFNFYWKKNGDSSESSITGQSAANSGNGTTKTYLALGTKNAGAFVTLGSTVFHDAWWEGGAPASFSTMRSSYYATAGI